ncbi:olfactory receptor 5V1-like [Aquarana catesbeiana]|uniref:olfactory receptor 5V1-like n=1 Tax=Aquarana catesbeiana TaxID=8400 RepID=UPI003CC97F9C
MTANNTMVTQFILLGFSMLKEVQPLLFPLFLFMYIVTVAGNVCIILTYNLINNLHTPMYFFLANFSFLEIFYVTSTIPNMLSNFLSSNKAISFYGCVIQVYCFLLLAGTECYMLAVMAFDRYNAICRPLLYTVIMNKGSCVKHIIGSWSIGAINAALHTVLTFSLPFCRSNQINHFFCEVPSLLKLSCQDTWINELTIFTAAGCIMIGSFILIMLSYIQIISIILQGHLSSGRKRAFSTCTSHLIVIAIFYGPGIIVYFRPKSNYDSSQDTMVALMYTVIAPLLNPFIYTLRNKEVKLGIKKIFCQKTRH